MSKRKSHSTIGKSFETDQSAIMHFRSTLPVSWLYREQKPDFFVDFVVETVTDGEPTGINFGVQVKGRSKLKYSKESVSLQFKTKHLSYYLEKCVYPVFVILVDIDTKKIFWLFAQKYINEMVSRYELTKGKVNLKIPIANKLESMDIFNSALNQSVTYMQHLHPGSIQAAIAKRKADLEAKDPRMQVEIYAEHGQERVVLAPKNPATNIGKITFKNTPEVQAGVRRMVEFGDALKISSNQVMISDMPIIEDALRHNDGEILFNLGNEKTGYIDFVDGNAASGSSLQVHGSWKAGTKFARFTGQLQDGLVRFSADFPSSSSQTDVLQGFTLTFEPRVWSGQRLLQLPYFQHVLNLFKGLASPAGMWCKCYITGVNVLAGKLRQIESDEFKAWISQVEWLERARTVALFHKINPILPSFLEITDQQAEDIEDAFSLLSADYLERLVPCVTMDAVLTDVHKEPSVQSEPTTIRIVHENLRLSVFGENVLCGRTELIWTEMSVSSVEKKSPNSVRVVFQGGLNSKKILKRAD
ncbi:MAG: DUF4365 domain-containing protein [Verrucomicrobiota bacterium]